MTNEEINKYIHTEIMGKCWHEREVDAKGTGGFKVKLRCVKCGDSRYRSAVDVDGPDYCSDSSPRSLLKDVVAKVGAEDVQFSLGASQWALEYTAEEIARACVDAHKALTGTTTVDTAAETPRAGETSK